MRAGYEGFATCMGSNFSTKVLPDNKELTNTAATHVVPELKLAVNSGGKECRRGGNDTVPW